MSHNDEVITLATNIVEDIERSQVNFSTVVLKSLRLSRLVKDEAMTTLLEYEQRGYPPDDPVALSLIGRTGRKGTVTAEGQSYYHNQSAAELDQVIAGFNHQIAALKHFTPSGQWAGVQLNTQVDKIGQYSKYAAQKIRVREIVTGILYDFALRVLNEYRFVDESADIYRSFQASVEEKLSEFSDIFANGPASTKDFRRATRSRLAMR